MCVALHRPHIAQTGPPGSEWPHTRRDGPAEKVQTTQTLKGKNFGLIKTKEHIQHVNTLTFDMNTVSGLKWFISSCEGPLFLSSLSLPVLTFPLFFLMNLFRSNLVFHHQSISVLHRLIHTSALKLWHAHSCFTPPYKVTLSLT